jgi:hypothetical protein
MNKPRVRGREWLVLIGTIASGCGAGETKPDGLVTAGSDAGHQPVPQAFVAVSLGGSFDPNHNLQNTCKSYSSTRELFAIGAASGSCNATTGRCVATGPIRVRDGDSQSGAGSVHIRCSVTAGNDVNLEASLGTTGTLQIVGHVDPTSGGQGLSADIGYQGSHYAGSSCAVTFTYGGEPVPQHPEIAPGRIWGHLSCPQMSDPNGIRQVVLMDMSQVPETCDGEADFIFENCMN